MWNGEDTFRYQEWDAEPEPDKHELKNTIILDAGMESTTWYYDAQNEGTAWMVFDGELIDIVK